MNKNLLKKAKQDLDAAEVAIDLAKTSGEKTWEEVAAEGRRWVTKWESSKLHPLPNIERMEPANLDVC